MERECRTEYVDGWWAIAIPSSAEWGRMVGRRGTQRGWANVSKTEKVVNDFV